MCNKKKNQDGIDKCYKCHVGCPLAWMCDCNENNPSSSSCYSFSSYSAYSCSFCSCVSTFLFFLIILILIYLCRLCLLLFILPLFLPLMVILLLFSFPFFYALSSHLRLVLPTFWLILIWNLYKHHHHPASLCPPPYNQQGKLTKGMKPQRWEEKSLPNPKIELNTWWRICGHPHTHPHTHTHTRTCTHTHAHAHAHAHTSLVPEIKLSVFTR